MTNSNFVITFLLSALLTVKVVAAEGNNHKDFTPYSQAVVAKLQHQHKPYVLCVSAVWCKACKKQQQAIRQLMKLSLFKDLVFIYADFDKHKTVVNQYQVKIVPTTVVVVNGQKAEVIPGKKTSPYLLKRITSLIAN